MSKIFRLYKGGSNTYEGWNNSPSFPYNSTNRDTIEDPEGASAKNEITSIPSPFARIDLVKTAFKEVCKKDKKSNKHNLDGKTIFHKMVSDALDVGEIFFNIDKYKNDIEIITWNASSMLSELKNDGNNAHFCVADALEKYLKADASTYNFDQLKNIYVLNYLNGPDELNIIGATSPATIFFSTANDLSYIKNIYFDQDRPFDNDYQPLYKRDVEYVKAWFTLRKSISNFSSLFPEIEEYLNQTFQCLTDKKLKTDIKQINSQSIDNFSAIEAKTSIQIDTVEILGFNIPKKKSIVVSESSDFTIKPTKQLTEKLPLVLPVESGNKYCDLVYTTGKWGEGYKAPYTDEILELANRTLPFDGTQGAYITIGDLLEDVLIRIPHSQNIDNYFSGNILIEEEKLSYLLPIKPLFFKYFSIEEFTEGFGEGRQFIEMNQLAGGSIKVNLRIPISGNSKVKYIEYSRIYYNGRSANAERNEGGVVEFDFTGHIMPLIKFANPSSDAYYNISCVSTVSRKYSFKFWRENSVLTNIIEKCRNVDEVEKIKSINYCLKNQEFDFIQVVNRDGYKGLIIPLFKKQRSITSFEFAIDLGTSNTHIEYKTQNEIKSKAFDFDKKETLACQFFKPSFVRGFQDDLIDEMALIAKDFIPEEFGYNEYKFPARTVLSCSTAVNWTDAQEPFELYNIPFTYDKRADLYYNNIKFNIKWGNGDDQFAMEAYVDCLMLILRNKVLLSDGDLSKTKITWFYPTSMSPKRKEKLRNTWDSSYNKYFRSDLATSSLTESAAPILYYFSRYATATNLINIDMGGGTTDVAFAKNKEILYVTSFKYATNVLFENPFSELDTNNGIVDWHKKNIKQLLEAKGLDELSTIFNSRNNVLPANMASFLFSLKTNSILEQGQVNSNALDFNLLLRDDENFKIVFILYYTSIIYHIAQIVKVKGLVEPRHIAFSGNGSKIINILTSDQKVLAEYTKLIFEEILERPYSGELDILGLDKDSNPKESTCKGGLLNVSDSDADNKIIILRTDKNELVNNELTYSDINEEYKKEVVKNISSFFDFVFNRLNTLFDFDNSFGVTKESLEIAKDISRKDLVTYLEKGIAQRLDESNGKNKVEETTFFYPIKGVINAISQGIYEYLQESNKN